MQIGEVSWQQADSREARDIEGEHERSHDPADQDLSAVNSDVEQHRRRGPQDDRERHVVNRRTQIADDEVSTTVGGLKYVPIDRRSNHAGDYVRVECQDRSREEVEENASP